MASQVTPPCTQCTASATARGRRAWILPREAGGVFGCGGNPCYPLPVENRSPSQDGTLNRHTALPGYLTPARYIYIHIGTHASDVRPKSGRNGVIICSIVFSRPLTHGWPDMALAIETSPPPRGLAGESQVEASCCRISRLRRRLRFATVLVRMTLWPGESRWRDGGRRLA